MTTAPLRTAPAQGSDEPAVVVAVVDPAGTVDRFDAYLPRRWAARRYPTLYDVDRPDLLVVGGATPFLVAAARLLHREATIVGVIDPQAPPRALIDVLHAGADACVRSSAPHVLASHLLAGHDRRLQRRLRWVARNVHLTGVRSR